MSEDITRKVDTEAEELIDEFMWCCTDSDNTAPLSQEAAIKIAIKHCELRHELLAWIDDEFHSDDREQDFNKAVIEKLEATL